jgi:hypothetical protein
VRGIARRVHDPNLQTIEAPKWNFMSEEQGQGPAARNAGTRAAVPTHQIVSDTGGSIEFLASVTREVRVPLEIVIAVEGIPELISAVRAGSSPISFYKSAAPRWFPTWLTWMVLSLLVYSAMTYLIARDGMSRGYDVEYTYRGLIPSITLRLSHPRAGDPARPPAP